MHRSVWTDRMAHHTLVSHERQEGPSYTGQSGERGGPTMHWLVMRDRRAHHTLVSLERGEGPPCTG